MVRASYDQKPYRKMMMNAFGAECIASPSNKTEAGRKILAEDPDNKGSLGIAISEAVEDALVNEEETNYAIGSVFNHVCLHQTVEGLEAKKQLEMVDDYPDVIYGCIGGGSSLLRNHVALLLRQSLQESTQRNQIRCHRSHSLPQSHQRSIPIRPRRHRKTNPARSHAHLRTRLHSSTHPRRRTPLPRHRPNHKRPGSEKSK